MSSGTINPKAGVLELKAVSKSYVQGAETLNVLKGVGFSLAAGQSLALCGPSGSGKSTLLHIAGLLDSPDAGEVHLNGQAVPRSDRERTLLRQKGLGFVFQFHHLLPEFTAVENVSMPLRLQGVSRKLAEQKAQNWLEKLGLADRLRHLPSELSGGEQQRVAIARALVHEPSVIIADEPTGSLDSKNGLLVARVLLDSCREGGACLLLATHNRELAELCDGILQLKDGIVDAAHDEPSYQE